MNILLIIGVLLFQSAPDDSAKTLTLRYCHKLVESAYPTADKIEYQKRITALNERIAGTGNYPDISLNGSASYQSDVTEVNFTPPGTPAPTFSKDRYKFSLDINQPIYDGGLTKAQASLEKSRGQQQHYSIEVELHQVKEQVNKIYFNILLLQQQMESTGVLLSELRQQLKEVRSKVKNGILLNSQASILQAEMIRAEQDSIKLQADLAGIKEALGILLDTEIGTSTRLVIPDAEVALADFQLNRPEYQLFSSTRRTLENQRSLAGSKKVPRLSAFGTAAYGRPGLNVFEDDLQSYFIVGLRLKWNVWDWFNGDREQRALRLEQQKVEADEEAFDRQLKQSISSIRGKIAALQEVIQRDEEIIELSREVVNERSSQLKNGIITSTEYLAELNRLHRARLQKKIHEVQLSQAKTDYQTQLGDSLQ